MYQFFITICLLLVRTLFGTDLQPGQKEWGVAGIDQQQCEHLRCRWDPLDAPFGAPRCVHDESPAVGKGFVLSTRGSSAFRIRFMDLMRADKLPIDSTMVQPDDEDASFDYTDCGEKYGKGIRAPFGSLCVTADNATFTLLNAAGRVLTQVSSFSREHLSLSSKDGALYGGGAGKQDAALIRNSVSPYVENKVVFVPHYWSRDGYAALGVANSTIGDGKTNYYPISFASLEHEIRWKLSDADAFELYLMPAASLDAGTRAYYALIGKPVVPPRYVFGFLASRYGWVDRSYIEETLQRFRKERYPIDAFITDFEWFTNESDYAFKPEGKPWYNDFGYYGKLFPKPVTQLFKYKNDWHFRMGGIRKPRLGNSALLQMAKKRGWILPGGERDLEQNATSGRRLLYALQRNLDYSNPEVRTWYAQKLRHFIKQGVSFFWNDEGETDYFTFYWWNMAQLESLRGISADQRFFSINRAWTPGTARLGATVWTGDISPSWDDLAETPAMMLNWGLAGAPYVTCDIGGFTGSTNGLLLTRWMQVGSFLPIMRVHSTKSVTPHFPFLWPGYEDELRASLELRYQLLPYHYSLAHRMYATNELWMRPLAAQYPDDHKARALTSQWLDGEILVAPCLRQDNKISIYLPEGAWYTFLKNSSRAPGPSVRGPTQLEKVVELNETPAFAPAGSLVPMSPVVQHTDDVPDGPLEMRIYSGADASFEMLEDDGETNAYQEGQLRSTRFAWCETTKTLTWAVTNRAPARASSFKSVIAYLYVSTGEVKVSQLKDLHASGAISFAHVSDVYV
eukprot:TRINITY_DN73299_c0_g1_i1.p1 TRINITY_DN73299_c0_g1~~TRINITY_DN73299_c0_g1_i1.p1  ORF type:complete len:794 (-),score=67.51 TRINITY_DN73299_c0_g1_i1:54-2435(-)